MLVEDNLTLKRSIGIKKNCGVSVYIDFRNVSNENRNQVEKAADEFLNLVKVILHKEQ